MKFTAHIEPTNPRHSDMVDAMAYLVSAEAARVIDEWVLLHIKPKPRWMPDTLWKWLLAKLLVLNRFKRPST